MSADLNQTTDDLAPWKRKRFRDYELSWTKAADSLSSEHPLIEARSNKSGSRWTIYDKNTDKIAIFHHAGVWSWAGPPMTGNFVPEGEIAPAGVFEGRITPTLSRRAEVSYAFNTQEDPSFYDAARAVEDHVSGLPDFNKYKKERRTWQDGNTEHSRRRFVFAARLVIRKTPYNAKEGAPYAAPYELHPWIDAALKAQKYTYWIPNPDMPTILDYTNGGLNVVKPENHLYFDNGDIVWFSFALTFEVNPTNWMPEFKPLDFIRVGRLLESSDSRAEYSVEAEVGAAYRSLTEGNVTLLDESDSDSGIASTTAGAKRVRDPDGDENMSDSGHSAYSAALAALDESPPEKRPKLDQHTAAGAKPSPRQDEPTKRRAPVKGKGKV